MNYLLDTHVLIWFLNGDKAFSSKARKAIEAENATNFISIASLRWQSPSCLHNLLYTLLYYLILPC
jgi:predicted nucleic acid-binding protein